MTWLRTARLGAGSTDRSPVWVALLLVSVLLAACGGGGADGEPAATGGNGDAGTEAPQPAGTADAEGEVEEEIQLGTVTANDLQHRILEVFAEELAAASDGRIAATVHAGGSIGDNDIMVQMLQAGTLHGVNLPTGFLSPFVKDYAVFDLPYLFQDFDEQREVTSSEAMEHFTERALEAGLYPLFHHPYSTSFRNLITTFPVETVEDIAGHRFRSHPSPIVVDTFESWNAPAVPLPLPEVYTALQQGTVDGLDNPIDVYRSTAHFEVAPYYTRSGHGSLTNVLVLSASWFDSLPEDLQQAVEAAGEATRDAGYDIAQELSEEALTALEANESVTITDLSDEDVAWMRSESQAVWETAYTDATYEAALEALGAVMDVSPQR